MIAVETGKIRIRSGGVETVLDAHRIDMATWVRIGVGKPGRDLHRVAADAGLYLLCRGRIDEAEKRFLEAREGIGLRLIQHYEKLIEGARIRAPAKK